MNSLWFHSFSIFFLCRSPVCVLFACVNGSGVFLYSYAETTRTNCLFEFDACEFWWIFDQCIFDFDDQFQKLKSNLWHTRAIVRQGAIPWYEIIKFDLFCLNPIYHSMKFCSIHRLDSFRNYDFKKWWFRTIFPEICVILLLYQEILFEVCLDLFNRI